MITGGDEVCILPPPTLSEKGVGIPTCVHYLFKTSVNTMKIVVETRLPLPTDSWLKYNCLVSMHLFFFAFTETIEKLCGGRNLYLYYIITAS